MLSSCFIERALFEFARLRRGARPLLLVPFSLFSYPTGIEYSRCFNFCLMESSYGILDWCGTLLWGRLWVPEPRARAFFCAPFFVRSECPRSTERVPSAAPGRAFSLPFATALAATSTPSTDNFPLLPKGDLFATVWAWSNCKGSRDYDMLTSSIESFLFL